MITQPITRIALISLLILSGPALLIQNAAAQEPNDGFTTDFNIEDCRFTSRGENPYFILLPGYQLILEGGDEVETVRVQITVLCETMKIDVEGIGKVKTRVVEEREWVNDELVEVSRNFFAICKRTNDVFYFGEEVDIYEDGNIVSHEGAWLAGEDGAMPGIIMPGTFLLGSRYYQELAPDVALDRAEHIAMDLTIETEAGEFENVVEILETTPLEPGEESTKFYARGIGLIIDDDIELIDFGFVSDCHCKKDKDEDKDRDLKKKHNRFFNPFVKGQIDKDRDEDFKKKDSPFINPFVKGQPEKD